MLTLLLTFWNCQTVFLISLFFLYACISAHDSFFPSSIYKVCLFPLWLFSAGLVTSQRPQQFCIHIFIPFFSKKTPQTVYSSSSQNFGQWLYIHSWEERENVKWVQIALSHPPSWLTSHWDKENLYLVPSLLAMIVICRKTTQCIPPNWECETQDTAEKYSHSATQT
jgi:hypothetical protein